MMYKIMGKNYKRTEFDELSYDIAEIKEKLRFVQELYSKIDNYEVRLSRLESPPKFRERIRLKIWEWLNWGQ